MSNGIAEKIVDEVTDEISDYKQNCLIQIGNMARMRTVLEKLRKKDDVKIAFLGGSITEGYLVNSKQNYPAKLTAYLKETYQDDNVTCINAGLSGTSSSIGLMRADTDVLLEEPDLIIIEFAVNDGQDTISKMMYESLVNKCLLSKSKPAVILLFNQLENGYTCEEQMKKVGEAYSLPMISMGNAIDYERENNKLTWSDYAQDEAHPTAKGHEMIKECLAYYLSVCENQIEAQEADLSEIDYESIHAYGAAYADMIFYNSLNLYPESLGGFVEANSDIAHFPNDWIWNKEDAGSLQFTLKGRNLFMLYKEANSDNMGTVEVYIDGKLETEVSANAADGWNNPEFAVLLNDVKEGTHTVEIRVKEDSIDKNFHILGFGTTGELTGKERVAREDIPYVERAIVREGNTSRLNKAIKKAEAGEQLTIGFIGGSITMGTGASSQDLCYASLVADWWKDTFQTEEINYINAGIGATTSEFACARADEDLLSYKPDVVFVEFSVNDSSTPLYQETYESLLRKVLQSDSKPAVIVLNMVQYDNGINAQSIHNQIAAHYDLPVISMKDSIFEEILYGRLTASQVSADNIHPNDTGHAMIAEIISSYLTKVKDKTIVNDAPYNLPESMQNLISIHSTRFNNKNSTPELAGFEPDTRVQNGITDIFKNGWQAKEAGDEITFTVTGSKIALQYKKSVSMNAPQAEVYIDGTKTAELDANYENGWGDWLYLDDIYTGSQATHTMTIRLITTAKEDFYLVSVITK